MEVMKGYISIKCFKKKYQYDERIYRLDRIGDFRNRKMNFKNFRSYGLSPEDVVRKDGTR